MTDNNEKPKYVSWNRANSVGHKSLDKEHQKMLSYINDTFKLIQEGQDNENRKELLTILDHITDYTDKHFSYEEAILESVNYSDLKAHQRIHADMRFKTQQIKREFFSQPGSDHAMNLLDFLREWWLNHINNVDKKYSSFIT